MSLLPGASHYCRHAWADLGFSVRRASLVPCTGLRGPALCPYCGCAVLRRCAGRGPALLLVEHRALPGLSGMLQSCSCSFVVRAARAPGSTLLPVDQPKSYDSPTGRMSGWISCPWPVSLYSLESLKCWLRPSPKRRFAWFAFTTRRCRNASPEWRAFWRHLHMSTQGMPACTVHAPNTSHTTACIDCFSGPRAACASELPVRHRWWAHRS